MVSGQKVMQRSETLDVDDYVMRLRTGGKKTRLTPRRGERRALEDRRSGLDRRMRNVPVAEDRRKNKQDRRDWSERRVGRDRRDLHVEYVGAAAFTPALSAGGDAKKKKKPGLLRKILKTTGFIED